MKNGKTCNNAHSTAIATRPWTPAEDAELRAGYPSYDILRKALPDRSLSALKHRVRTLGIVRRRHVWTNPEVRRLHAAFEANLPGAALLDLFPGLSLCQIKSKAGHVKAARRKARLVPFGIPALDAVRSRAQDEDMSLVELDRCARTGRFFQKSCRRPNLRLIVRAASILGGDVEIEWSDEE